MQERGKNEVDSPPGFWPEHLGRWSPASVKGTNRKIGFGSCRHIPDHIMSLESMNVLSSFLGKNAPSLTFPPL